MSHHLCFLSDIGIHLRDRPFSSDVRIINFHPTKGTHWIAYINENFFGSYGYAPPQKFSKFTIKQNGHCLYSEYKIQCLTYKRDYDCASYRLYIIYLTKVLRLVFKSAVLTLYYQTI